MTSNTLDIEALRAPDGTTTRAIAEAKRNLTPAQRYHLVRGCISGDCTMATIRALKAKRLFYLKIDSPNGRCGFMELTPLGKAVRAAITLATGGGE